MDCAHRKTLVTCGFACKNLDLCYILINTAFLTSSLTMRQLIISSCAPNFIVSLDDGQVKFVSLCNIDLLTKQNNHKKKPRKKNVETKMRFECWLRALHLVEVLKIPFHAMPYHRRKNVTFFYAEQVPAHRWLLDFLFNSFECRISSESIASHYSGAQHFDDFTPPVRLSQIDRN